MELPRDILLPFVTGLLDQWRDRPDAKWVFSLQHKGRSWSEKEIEGIWAELRSMNMKETVEEEELIAFTEEDTLMLSIQGIRNITRYCNTDDPVSVSHRWLQREDLVKESMPEEISPTMDVSCSLRFEQELTLEEDPFLWLDQPKYFLLRKRFVYENEDFRYVLQFERKSDELHHRMADSKVTSQPFDYSLSIETKPSMLDAKDPLSMMDGIALALQVIHNDAYLLSSTQANDILDAYSRLVDTAREPYRRDRGSNSQEGPQPLFLAPKPITLERMHLLDPSKNYGVTSILSGYAVTEKADGERVLFYVHTDGFAYIINNTLDIHATGLHATSPKMHSTIIDGEYIVASKRKDKAENDLFVAFDIYFMNAENLMKLPLLHATQSHRMKHLTEVFNEDLWEALDTCHVDIRVKNHIAAEGTEMFDACRQILSETRVMPYDIDGLVFTPVDLPVFGYYPGKFVKLNENVRWSRVFKWKPSEQNTIDFLIEYDGKTRRDPMTKDVYGVIKLYTGYNASQWEPISVDRGIRIRYDKNYREERKAYRETYRAKAFVPITQYEKGVEEAHVKMNQRKMFTEEGHTIQNRQIVEFAYHNDLSIPVSRRWVPLRVREDKTRIFQKTGKLSKTANDLSVAMSIWRTIHLPVTTSMITGVTSATQADAPEDLEERLLGVDDTYYAREIPRQHMLSVHMLNFHNHGIKKMLYNISNKRSALLELACGMAGDLPRWRDSGYHSVLGVDLARDNITHPKEGSYARAEKQYYVLKENIQGMDRIVHPKIVFVIGNCAKTLRDGSAADELDEESKKVLRYVYQRNAVPPAPYYRRITGLAADGFDVVSCQFAIHYFFESRDTLNGFLSNVSDNLRPGGIFIATFMDGDKVNALLQDSNGVVEGKKGDITVWALIKKYQEYLKEGEEPFKKTVRVFLENTNQLINEFLVHLPLLTTYAHAHNLVLEKTGLFSETFADLVAGLPSNPNQYSSLQRAIAELRKDDVQTRFSFLNRWVVFKKI